jgi:endonuclease YncB( thermonuclease family)
VDLAGINAPELRKATMTAGKEARDALRSKIADKPLIVRFTETPTNERANAVLYAKEGDDWVNVNEWMVSSRYAVATEGGKGDGSK